MDAITVLKDDHKAVERLFRSLEKRDTSVVPEICRELTVHTQIEERVFYPAIRAAGVETAPAHEDLVEEVAESVQEHHVAKVLVSELESMDSTDDQYLAKATVLMELVRHHIREEEGDMFPEVRETLGRRRLQELGQEMLDLKQSLS